MRTSDFGPHPKQWVDHINDHYDQLWVHSEWTRQHALNGGVAREMIRVVPHGVDAKVFRPLGEAIEIPTNKKCRFLFVGGAVERKGIDVLLEAYTNEFTPDDDVCLVIKDHPSNIFYREHPHRDQIRRLAADPETPEIVYLDEHLSSLDLAALYRACTVGVWPYRAEGFLIHALECMACGTPTVLPDIGPTTDYSSPDTSFFVRGLRVRLPMHRNFRMRLGYEIMIDEIDFVQVRPFDLAQTLRRVYLAESHELSEMSAAGVLRAVNGWTWRHVADRIDDCFEELMASPPKYHGR